MRWVRRAVAIAALAAAAVVVWWGSGAHSAQATPGWGIRSVATNHPAGDQQQSLYLWAVQTPSGMHACVTANYGEGHSHDRPLAISCDWGR